MKGFVKGHPLLTFFGLVFLSSWGLALPAALLAPGSFPAVSAISYLLLGPTTAGVIVIAVTSGRRGFRLLFERVLRWRAGWHWYAIVFVGVPALQLGATAVASVLTDGTLRHFDAMATLLRPEVPLGFLVVAVITEELGGWRGFALPTLLRRLGGLPASVVLGALWGLWHLPLGLVNGFAPAGFVLSLVSLVAVSVLMTWIFVGTGGSALIAGILFHFLFNAASFAYVGVEGLRASLAYPIVFAVAAAGVVAVTWNRFPWWRPPTRPLRDQPQPAGGLHHHGRGSGDLAAGRGRTSAGGTDQLR